MSKKKQPVVSASLSPCSFDAVRPSVSLFCLCACFVLIAALWPLGMRKVTALSSFLS